MHRRLALLATTIGATLFLAVGVAVGAVPRLADTGSSRAAAGTDAAGAALAAAPAPTADTPAADPNAAATGAEAAAAPEASVGAAAVVESTPTIEAPAEAAEPEPPPAPVAAPPAPPAPPKYVGGQRLEPTSAQVQAAMAQLHGRIPLFQPTESQLRTFAEAVCGTFDQGQTKAQVEAAVRQAVSNVAGASLTAADAEFAVHTVVELRCPGYLP
jgi:hypothetical protein